MTPLPLPLFATASSGPAAGSLVRVEGLEGSWRVRRAGDGWVDVVGEGGFRTVEVGRVRVGRER